MHGRLCFAGTRVPLTVFLDNFAEGMGVDEFVREYPSVKREQALAIIAWQRQEMNDAIGLDLAS